MDRQACNAMCTSTHKGYIRLRLRTAPADKGSVLTSLDKDRYAQGSAKGQ